MKNLKRFHIGKLIEEEMIARNWSFPRLAKESGVSISTLKQVVNPKTKCRLIPSDAQKVSIALGLHPVVLLRVHGLMDGRNSDNI